MEPESSPSHIVERHVHYHSAASTSMEFVDYRSKVCGFLKVFRFPATGAFDRVGWH